MNPQDDPNGMQDLDFGTATAPGERGGHLACTKCDRQILGSYYEVDGEVVCEECRYRAEAEADEGSPSGRFGRALAGGLGGAVVGAGIYYAVLAISGYEVGLVAILVGLLVGGGVRWGAKRRGGWAYQTLAIVLTYLAIVSTYVPFILQGIEEAVAQEEAATVAEVVEGAEEGALEADMAAVGLVPLEDEAAPAAEDGAATVAEVEEELGAGGFLIAVVLIAFLAMAAPFLAGFENLIGLAIIGFALYQAWKMNQRHRTVITGPYTVGSGAPAPAPIELPGPSA